MAALGVTVLPSLPASAAPAELEVEYICTPTGTSSIVRHGPVRLTTNLTFETDLVVGGPLKYSWKLGYTGDGSRLQSPGYFGPGGQVHAVGNLELKSNWVGILQPKGSAEPEDGLRPDDPLGLPPLLNSPGMIDKAGTIRITPKDIDLDFTPPDNSVVINDGDDADNPSDMQIVYNGTWTSIDDRPSSEHHVHNDLHETTELGASAELTFIGTSVTYIGPTDKDAGPVDIYLDGIKRATVDPSRDADDDPVNDDLDGGQELWKSPELTYGKHVVKVANASTKQAWLDAFEVSTATSQTPTGFHSAKCKPASTPGTIVVTVGEPQTSPTPTVTHTPTNSPTITPTSTGTGSPTSTSSASVSPSSQITHPSIVIVGPGGTTGTPTATPTGSARPTVTKYVRPQVVKTPKGGVNTGEAPDPPLNTGAYTLIAGGSAMFMASAAGGLLVWRRRAAHAGGVK
ncbi:hypothetical protein MF672_014770 [Actinomadura sp. ATCC 31491]|uniref:LPXTG cell wall anchor domain-containing protein n=1 Tax=Actinomadura luzonensis TaxID=2805427 RepID=A0ABT0FSR6_9ACTN|nr:hypothetical protein [Actinomadura luzonensis]MCK2215040.1 hypothetical protein [Actinomadura luzonensis]